MDFAVLGKVFDPGILGGKVSFLSFGVNGRGLRVGAGLFVSSSILES
jgi:hypothetical protein